MTLKELRIKKGLTQLVCAQFLGVSLRTYIRYESDDNKANTLKYRYMLKELETYGYIDEQHGVLTVESIKNICAEIFERYAVEYCYLFGSYAKGKATPTSDVDLLVSTNVKGIKFYGLVEEIRTVLHKNVDVLNIDQLKDNVELTEEIFKDGVKIYG